MIFPLFCHFHRFYGINGEHDDIRIVAQKMVGNTTSRVDSDIAEVCQAMNSRDHKYWVHIYAKKE